MLNKTERSEDTEKDDDEEFWMNTCNSFVVQLAETHEKKKVKLPVKRKSLKEQLPQLPKRKYTKRIKIDTVSEVNDKKLDSSSNDHALKSTEEVKSEPQENLNKSIKAESLDMDKENKTKLENKEKSKSIKEIENDEESEKMKPKRKRLFKQLPITKMKKLTKEDKKEIKMKEIKKESKKGYKKELLKKELLLQKPEKKELLTVSKEEKKLLKKEEKRDSKKEQQQQDNNKKDLNNKKDNVKKETPKKKIAAEKENATKINENTARKSVVSEAIGKFNPRQSLRRKNSLKDYTFAFDELLDDAFAHFEADKIPVKRRRKCGSPSPPNLTPAVLTTVHTQSTVVKKTKDKDNETIRMRLRSRNRPLLTKQEPQKIGKKKVNTKIKNIPKRRRKKSLGEKSAHANDTANNSTTENWRDELYKFKRSLRLPSKLISMVSPPTAGDVDPDQVSLTSIMNIPQLKDPKATKSTTHSQAVVAGCKVGKTKRLGHLFGRRDVFKGRRLLKREKIVSAEKLMQRNLRKRRQLEGEEKKEACADEKTAEAAPFLEDEEVHIEEEEDDDDGGKPPRRMLFKRKFMRKKFRSGFDYIKKKKKKESVSPSSASEKKPISTAATTIQTPKCSPRFVSDIQAEIKGWIVNKGHGETVLHRAARLGVKVS